MRDAVIVEAVRTPVGRRKGMLADLHPVDLSSLVLTALADRTGIDIAAIDDVVWGCVGQVGEQSANIARYAALAAGWPETVPGTTVDRQCGSSQQAISFAAASVIAGHADLIVAGGVESMTRVPMGSAKANGPGLPFGPRVAERYDHFQFNQGRGAEILAQRYDLSRTRLDEIATESHSRAAKAIDGGRFDGQIVPVELPDGTTMTQDEGLRRDTTVDSLANLEPAFAEDGRITAGNASQMSDGSAAVLITTSENARKLGLAPIARVHTATVVGDDPITMLEGPIPATRKVLRKAGLTLEDIGAFEVNEAFASVSGAWLEATGADSARVNPNGGAIALGHPLGGSGARLATTLIHHLRDEGLRYGLQTMCEGGGMANATIFENLTPGAA